MKKTALKHMWEPVHPGEPPKEFIEIVRYNEVYSCENDEILSLKKLQDEGHDLTGLFIIIEKDDYYDCANTVVKLCTRQEETKKITNYKSQLKTYEKRIKQYEIDKTIYDAWLIEKKKRELDETDAELEKKLKEAEKLLRKHNRFKNHNTC